MIFATLSKNHSLAHFLEVSRAGIHWNSRHLQYSMLSVSLRIK